MLAPEKFWVWLHTETPQAFCATYVGRAMCNKSQRTACLQIWADLNVTGEFLLALQNLTRGIACCYFEMLAVADTASNLQVYGLRKLCLSVAAALKRPKLKVE
jgi:hypothetical protein